MNDKSEGGQALIEYIILFSIFASISIGLAKGLGNFMSTSLGGIGAALNTQLKTGICERECFFNGYINQ